MNAIIEAQKAAQSIIAECLGTQVDNTEERRKELTKLPKEKLVEMLIEREKIPNSGVTVESIAKRILEDPRCAWLTYEMIASMIANAKGSKTSHKCIADYVSKRGWNCVARKSNAERNAELLKLVNG